MKIKFLLLYTHIYIHTHLEPRAGETAQSIIHLRKIKTTINDFQYSKHQIKYVIAYNDGGHKEKHTVNLAKKHVLTHNFQVG